MDSDQFDRLTRLVGTRRTFGLALSAGTLLGLADVTKARKTNRKNCKVKRIKICHAAICGKRKNNCGKTYHCKCRGGQTCLPNKSCGTPCPAECPQQPFACACPASGDQFCVQTDLSCELTAKQCSSMAECPAGRVCAETACGPGNTPEKRCVPLCHPVP
jgi:hypothetical protein